MKQVNDVSVLSEQNLNIPISGKKPVQVIAITGGKGGIGKTNIALNIAVAMAKRNQKVLLFDADLGLANLDVLLGLRVKRDLHQVLTGQCRLDEVVIRGPHGVLIVPATSGMTKMAELSLPEQASIIHAFSTLSHDVDTLLIDTAAGISSNVTNFVHAAQEIIVVVCNEPTSIADAYAMIKVLNQQYGVKHFKMLANMIRNQNEAKELYNKLRRVCDRFLQISLQDLGSIPYDDHLRLAVRHQRAVVDEFPGCRASVALNQVAQKIKSWTTPVQNNGRIAFFLERLLQTGV